MHDYYSSQQIQMNLFMCCTDPNNNRPQVIKGYYYFYFKESLLKSSNYDFPVIRKNVLLVLEKNTLSK